MTTTRTTIITAALLGAGLIAIASGTLPARGSAAPAAAADWRTDPVWHDGKAESALYDGERPIYGKVRRYEATLFTNKQFMDPATTTKAERWQAPGTIEVFKHNLSEMIPTENYTYRFLTTCFNRVDDLEPYKLAFSSQEDCGTTYKQLVVGDEEVRAHQFCYFPNGGHEPETYRRRSSLAFHDALSLTLRDYPFDAPDHPLVRRTLIADQTDTHETALRPEEAQVTYAGRETLTLPYGAVDAHHLRVTHASMGGATTSDYWFAADPALRRVMVRYEGPYGVKYRLKRLERWAYWAAPRPK